MNPSLSVVNRYIEAEDVFQSAMHTFSDTQELDEEDPPLTLLCQSPSRMWHAGSVRFPVIGREPILIMLAVSVYVWIEKIVLQHYKK